MISLDRIIVTLLSILLFSLPLSTAYVFGAVGNSPQYGMLSFTLLDGILALLAVAGIARIMGYGVHSIHAYAKAPVICGALFVVYTFLSAVWSQEPMIAIISAARFGGALVACALLIAYRKHSMIFLSAIISSAVIQSIIAIWQFVVQESPAFSWLGMAYHSAQQLGDAVVEVADQRWLRAYGSLPHPNVLGGFLSFTLFAIASIVRRIETKRAFFMILGAWIVSLAAFFFTFSREVWLGTIVGITVLAILRKSYKIQWRIISPAMILGLTALILWVSLSVVYWEPLSARLGIGGWQRLEQRSFTERITSYTEGWSLVKSSPFIGVGMHQASFALAERDAKNGQKKEWYAYQPPHNVALLITSELGVVGMLLFVVLVFMVVRYLWKTIAFDKAPLLLGAVCMIALSSLFDHFYWSLQPGVLLWWVGIAFLAFDDRIG